MKNTMIKKKKNKEQNKCSISKLNWLLGATKKRTQYPKNLGGGQVLGKPCRFFHIESLRMKNNV